MMGNTDFHALPKNVVKLNFEQFLAGVNGWRGSALGLCCGDGELCGAFEDSLCRPVAEVSAAPEHEGL